MGNRVKGEKRAKPKKKGVKAKVNSRMGSKRRIARMGKEQKKGHRGVSANFMTRARVLKKLQLSLKDFRRLCILKGIYPREPNKKPAGRDKTYYHIKDVSYLAHEPLIDSFRQFKAFMKKVRKAAGRRSLEEARRKEAMAKPTYTLHHLVKERYPRFTDALRDLDDALCLVHLFAAMPQVQKATAPRVAMCKRLVREWQFLVARTRCVSKVFVSIKGVYFQAEVQGLPITWLAPHQFTTQAPPDVDFRIMLCFLEFYEVLLKFVMFKLYTGEDLRYPPALDADLEGLDAGLSAVKAHGLSEAPLPKLTVAGEGGDGSKDAQKAEQQPLSKAERRQLAASAARISTLEARMKDIEASEEGARSTGADGDGAGAEPGDEEEDETLGDALAVPLEAAFMAQSDEGSTILAKQDSEEERRKRLFKGLRFFLGREVPRHWMEFIIVACGGAVGWDGPGSPYGMNDAAITHQVVDRPLGQIKAHKDRRSRELVQPQWVLDSINACMRLPTERYAPGAELPPHLSPFVADASEGYVPKYREELNSLKAASKSNTYATLTAVSGTSAQAPQDDGSAAEQEGDQSDSGEDDSDEEAYAREVELEAHGVAYTDAKARLEGEQSESEDDDTGSGEESEGGDGSAAEGEEQDGGDSGAEEQEEAEGGGAPESEASGAESDEEADAPAAATPAPTPAPDQPLTEAEELHELSKIMMSKKAKRLYGRMQHGIGKRREEIDRLKAKRRAIEAKYDAPAASKKKQKRAK